MAAASDPLAEIRALRMTAQRLWRPAADPVDAVGSLLAMQGQDHDGMLWSTGRRTVSPDRADVAAAFASGRLVRTWPMRGTLHVMRVDDVRPLLALTRERATAAAAGIHRREGITDSDRERAASVAAETLSARRLPRRELLDALAARGVDVSGQRGAHHLVRLAQDGVIVVTGAREFAAAADLLPVAEPWEREDALAWLARRYLAGHGPATARDLAWWAGLTLTEARSAFAAVRDEATVHRIGEVEYLALGDPEPAPSAVLALSGFDEWVLGYGDRRAALGDEPLTRVAPGANGMFLPTIVIDGVIAGTWSRVRRAAGDVVTVAPWRRIPVRRMPAVRQALRERIRFDGRIAVLD